MGKLTAVSGSSAAEVRGSLMAPAHESGRNILLYDSAGEIVPHREIRNGAQKWQLAPGDYCRIETREGRVEVALVTINMAGEGILTKWQEDAYADLPPIWRSLLPATLTRPRA